MSLGNSLKKNPAIPILYLFSLFLLTACSNGPLTFGTPYKDIANAVQQTADGGYIIAGYTWAYGTSQPTEWWIVKLNAQRQKEWDKMYGSYRREFAYAIQETTDQEGNVDGYIIAGTRGKTTDDVYWQIWVVKIDLNGNQLWDVAYGGPDHEQANAIQQTSDGGYIVAGFTSSFGPKTPGDSENPTTSAEARNNCWIVKLSPMGELEWDKVYGGEMGDGANAVQQTPDGGYLVAGFSASHTPGVGNYDFWVMKLDTDGNNGSGEDACNVGEVCWSKTYGGSHNETATSIDQTADGGYVVAGETWSESAGNNDFWILKLDTSGNGLWNKKFGGTKNESAKSVQQTADGGYIVAGYTNSPEFEVSSHDGWILKLDENGNQVWGKTYGGVNYDILNSIRQTTDGGYIAAGASDSYNLGTAAQMDFWVLKLDADGKLKIFIN